MWPELVDRYLDELAAGGRRPHTIRGYRGDLAGLAATLSRDGSDAGLAAWASSLDDLAAATRARRRSAALGFLRWAAARGVAVGSLRALKRRDGPVGRRPATVPAPDPDAVEAALAAIPLQADRDQLLFNLMARMGLRPGEALALQVDDFDEQGGRLRVRGWGGAVRSVLVDDAQVQLRLTHWIRGLGRSSGPLFCAPGQTAPLRYESVRERWARYAAGANLRLGDLRLHHAAQLLAGGVPEWTVRERLGQLDGPLPCPSGATADEHLLAWRRGTDAPTRSRRRRTTG